MELYEVIASFSGWETKTASQLVDLLNATTVEVRDDQFYTWAGIADNIDSPNTENLKRLMETSDLSWATIQFGGKGLPLSHPGVQACLTQFVANGVPGASTLKDIGIHYESLAQNAGLAVVTLSEVQSAVEWLTLQATKQQLIKAGADRWNAYVVAVEAWEGSELGPLL